MQKPLGDERFPQRLLFQHPMANSYHKALQKISMDVVGLVMNCKKQEKGQT
jgi:hypothetical protein